MHNCLQFACINPAEPATGSISANAFAEFEGGTEPGAAAREGAGFRLAISVSRCPKPRRGEAVAPAPVGVPVGQGVSRRRSASPLLTFAYERRFV